MWSWFASLATIEEPVGASAVPCTVMLREKAFAGYGLWKDLVSKEVRVVNNVIENLQKVSVLGC